MTKQLAMSLFKFWAEGSKSDYDRLLQFATQQPERAETWRQQKDRNSHCSLMSQDSKINAETHGLFFWDEQKPKQIQMYIPHKNIKNIQDGRRGCSR